MGIIACKNQDPQVHYSTFTLSLILKGVDIIGESNKNFFLFLMLVFHFQDKLKE